MLFLKSLPPYGRMVSNGIIRELSSAGRKPPGLFRRRGQVHRLHGEYRGRLRVCPLLQRKRLWGVHSPQVLPGADILRSHPGARSRGPDRWACQNRRWCLLSPRSFYDGYCPKVCFLGAYKGVAFEPEFLCGNPRIADEGAFSPPDFGGAHRSEPRLHMTIYSHYFRDTKIAGI